MAPAQESDLPETLRNDLLAIFGLDRLPPPRPLDGSRDEARGARRRPVRQRRAAIRPIIPRLILSRTASASLGAVLILTLAGGGAVLLRRALDEQNRDGASGGPGPSVVPPMRSADAVAPPRLDPLPPMAALPQEVRPMATVAEGRFAAPTPAVRAPDRGGKRRDKASGPPEADSRLAAAPPPVTPASPEVAPGRPSSSPDVEVAAAPSRSTPGDAGPAPAPSEDLQVATNKAQRRDRTESIDALRALRR